MKGCLVTVACVLISLSWWLALIFAWVLTVAVWEMR